MNSVMVEYPTTFSAIKTEAHDEAQKDQDMNVGRERGG